MAFFSAILRGLGHIWHLLAIAYFLVLFVLSQFDIGNSLRFMMSATVKSLLVVGVGALLSGMLTRWIFRRISLPTDVNLRYPMLERRINSYIPNGLKILRVMVVLAVTLFLLDAWHLINLYQWAGSENGQRTLGGLVHILLILLIAVFSWTLMASIIEHRLALELSNGVRPSARERTLLTLFRNVLAIVISTITVMIVLSQVGLNIAPLLAGAGALGLAISFGAQTLVKDVITGVFIQFENGMNTGEYVTVSGITGTVERMTIRSIGLRDDYGVYHIVPYSSITTLANYAREFGVYRANYTVSRDEDIDRVNEVLHQAVAALKQDEQVKHFLIGEPVFNGVVALGDRSFTTRVTVRTQALKQWVVQYALDRLVKIHFDRAGIGMPQQAMQIPRAAAAGTACRTLAFRPRPVRGRTIQCSASPCFTDVNACISFTTSCMPMLTWLITSPASWVSATPPPACSTQVAMPAIAAATPCWMDLVMRSSRSPPCATVPPACALRWPPPQNRARARRRGRLRSRR